MLGMSGQASARRPRRAAMMVSARSAAAVLAQSPHGGSLVPRPRCNIILYNAILYII